VARPAVTSGKGTLFKLSLVRVAVALAAHSRRLPEDCGDDTFLSLIGILIRHLVALTAIQSAMRAVERKPSLCVLIQGERGRPEPLSFVAGQTIATLERTVFELASVRIAMTCSAIIRRATRISAQEIDNLGFTSTEAVVTPFTSDVVVWNVQRKSGYGVQFGIEGSLRTVKGFVDCTMTVFTRALWLQIHVRRYCD
jgi:hypothetical protein